MLPSNALYLRDHEVLLVIKPPIGEKENATFEESGTSLVIKNRVSFSCQKTTMENTNKSKIDIYNVNQKTQSFLEDKNLVLFLKAGYGKNKETIYIGDVLRREVVRSGSDIVFSLELGDTGKALSRNALQISYKGKVATKQILDDAIAALGAGINDIKDFISTDYEKGFSYSGLASTLIIQLCKAQKLNFYVENGMVNIKKYAEAGTAQTVIIKPDTGLIGSPTKTQIGVQFTSLLNGKLNPGQLVSLQSQIFQGQTGRNSNLIASAASIDSGDLVVVTTATHEGDTMGNNWVTHVEAVKAKVSRATVEGTIFVEGAV